MIAAAAVATVVLVVPAPRRARLAGVAAAGALGVGVLPAMAVAVAVVAAGAVRRIRDGRRTAAVDAADELLAIDLVALGVAGGLGFAQAVSVAASSVGGAPRRHLRAIHRRLSAGSSPVVGAGRLTDASRIAERSSLSGAALGPALATVAETARRERAAAERARLGRLPVRMLFPLALLILPGFVLLAVGPTVVSGLSRLSP